MKICTVDCRVTMEIPERFEDGDDVDEDCTAPKGQNGLINVEIVPHGPNS